MQVHQSEELERKAELLGLREPVEPATKQGRYPEQPSDGRAIGTVSADMWQAEASVARLEAMETG